MRKKNIDIEKIICVLVTILLLFVIKSCVQFNWEECRKVGHGKIYCIGKVMNG
jgi:hypothetical protein